MNVTLFRWAPLALFGLACSALGQRVGEAVANGRVEQARTFGNYSNLPQTTALSEGGLIPAGQAPPSPGDRDLGQQVLLKERERAAPYTAFASISGFYTSNAALTNAQRVDDFFFIGEAGVSYQPRIARDWVAEFTVRDAMFRYAHYGVLDFESLNIGGGLTYFCRPLGGTAFSIRYNFNRLTDGTEHDEFFKNQTVTFAALRTFQIGTAQSIYVGASALLGWSDPVAPQRDEYGVTLGYHVSWTRAFSTDLLYRPALFYYTHGRKDWDQTITLALRYDVTRWFNMTGTLSGGFNNSNEHVFNYQVFNAGAALTGNLTF